MKWLLWLLLLDDITKGDVQVHWPPRLPNIESGWGKLLLFLFAVAAVAGIIYAYRREPDYVSKRKRRTLAALRIGAVLLLLFVLTGAFLDLSRAESSQGTLVLLFDTSRSMTLADRRLKEEDLKAGAKVLGLTPGLFRRDLTAADRETINKTTRDEMVKKAMANSDLGFMRAVGKKYRVEAFTFGGRSEVSPLDLSPMSADGGPLAKLGAPSDPATQLGGPLREAVRRLKGQYVVAAVPFTDGAWNRGEDPLIAAQDLGVPVCPVGVGLPQTRDVEIPFIFVENVVFKGDTFPLYVRIKQRGYAGNSGRLIVKRGAEVVEERMIEFGDRGEWTHIVNIMPEEEGTFTFSAEIEPFEDEMSNENNAKARPGVRVIDKKIHVLVVEDAPRWEFRFLKAVLEADDKRLKASFVLRQADDDLVNQRGSSFKPHFPTTKEDLRPYNLVVLGNIANTFFTREELKNLEEYVREEGGALLVIAGRNHMPDTYKETPIEDLLPIQFQPQPEWRAEDDLMRTASTGFRVVLTPEGKRSAVLRLAAEETENESLWDEAQPIHRFYPAERLKPAATALLVHPTESNRHGPVPLVAHHRYGKGQVMYFGIDETWRWRFRPGSEHHRTLWGQAVTFLSMANLLGETNRIQIETDRSEYAVGDGVKIVARILDESYDNLVAESVTSIVERGGLDKEELALAAVAGQKGVFQGDFRAALEGRYRVTIQGEEDEAEHYFAVTSPQIEFDDPGMRRELLEQVAEASGGEFVLLHDLDTLPEKLGARSHQLEPRREERPLWNAPGIVILVTILLGAEWFIRKRSDLL